MMSEKMTMREMRALVLRAPGINCDRETAHACRLAGFEVDLLHINSLLQAPERLLDYDFLVLSGGFSYGDDLGAGTLLAKNLTVHLGTQLRQFIDEGRPVLGICNGFQVLVRAGLLPDNAEETSALLTASLTDNASAQFECRWVRLSVQDSACIFTQNMTHTIELPVAHGEGQFVLADATRLTALQVNGQAPLVYGDRDDRSDGVAYPDNPNGSPGNIAGVCNARGNVLGLMPHPERYVSAMQHPQRRGTPDGQGDGLPLFKNACTYAQKLAGTAKNGTPKQTAHEYAEPTRHSEHAERVGQTEHQLAHAHSTATKSSYAASGVSISAAETAKRLMKVAVSTTQGPEVLAGMGAFAGVLDAQFLQQMRRPALVASTDGVGTKTLLAEQSGRFDSIGYDLVNHSVNDLLTQGAKPLFFMDYLAMGKLNPVKAATIVRGIAEACAEVGCSLLGGETAEMPDVYLPSAFDLAGTIVGVVEQDELMDYEAIEPGNVLLGLPSNGLHTNGYSLARRIFAPYALDTVFPELGEPLVDALLRPHRCYLREIERIREYVGVRGHSIKGMAHITGGGFAGNVSRILPEGVQAVIETKKWRVPSLFRLLARLGQVSSEEMYQTFNMGVGMVLVLSPKGALEARCVLPELVSVGYITQGEGVVVQL
ncbi:MAG: phosphoribosylformylglycinamidine cyclo-ligase [Ktedonobacteraceae bacterium]